MPSVKPTTIRLMPPKIMPNPGENQPNPAENIPIPANSTIVDRISRQFRRVRTFTGSGFTSGSAAADSVAYSLPPDASF